MTGNVRHIGIDEGMRDYRRSPGAVLINVRSPGEHSEGRIPGSLNLPLIEIPYADALPPDCDTPVYVYCASGRRSRQAAAVLDQMGYTDITDMGGMDDYTGETEK